jgi:hypothetical protein
VSQTAKKPAITTKIKGSGLSSDSSLDRENDNDKNKTNGPPNKSSLNTTNYLNKELKDTLNQTIDKKS